MIHDRYRARMLAYTRQMLAGSPQDPEDAVQEIFVRAYSGLRANRRELALRAWLYRIAHNRCVDELRRPHAIALEAIDSMIPGAHDPVAKVEQRDSLRRLIADVQRLPEQQRSALLMREMSGMAYADVAGALGVSVPAVKSLLVRARLGLAQANEARDTACAEIREDLIASHDRGVRASGLARRHMRDCPNCREFRTEVRGVSRRFAALTPTLGPIGVIANLLGWGGGGGAVAGSGTAAAGSGAAASAGALAGGAGHVVTLLAAAVVATGGAVEIQHTLATPSPHRAHHHRVVTKHQADTDATPASTGSSSSSTSAPTHAAVAAAAAAATGVDPAAPAPAPTRATHPAAPRASAGSSSSSSTGQASSGHTSDPTKTLPIAETLDPDNMMYGPNANNGTASANGTATTGSTSGSSATSSSTPSGATTGATSGTATGGTTGSGTAATTSGGGTSGTPGTTGTTSGSPTPIGSSTGTGTSGGGSGVAPGGSAGSGSGDGTTGAGTGSGSASAVGSTSSTGAGSLSSFEQSR